MSGFRCRGGLLRRHSLTSEEVQLEIFIII